MKEEGKEQAERLAAEHWEWFQKVVGHVAKDFFIHGYKHGANDAKKRRRQEQEKAP